MSKRVLIPGLSALCAFAMIGSVAATAMAQQVPVRVVQSSDGTLFLVQGTNAVTLVPDQVSDADLAALNVTGEADGTVPNDWLAAQAPTTPPAPQPPAAAPVAPAPGPAPITGAVDLTGKASSDIYDPTPIAVGATITSIVDTHTKLHDAYSVNLSAGIKYTMTSSSTNKYGGPAVIINVLNPDRSLATAFYPGGGYSAGCTARNSNEPCVFIPAVSGTYVLDATPQGSTQNYTFTIRQT